MYDPFCGGGTLLTVIGFLASAPVALLAGSDLDADALRTAEQNLALLSREGLCAGGSGSSAVLRLWGNPPTGTPSRARAAGRPPSGSPSAHPGIPGGRLRASLPAGPGAAGGYRRHRHPLRSADALAGGGGRPFARLCGADPGRHGPAGSWRSARPPHRPFPLSRMAAAPEAEDREAAVRPVSGRISGYTVQSTPIRAILIVDRERQLDGRRTGYAFTGSRRQQHLKPGFLRHQAAHH